MITKLDIQEKDGFLTMKDFPMNCIFNKVKPCCDKLRTVLQDTMLSNPNYNVKDAEIIEIDVED